GSYVGRGIPCRNAAVVKENDRAQVAWQMRGPVQPADMATYAVTGSGSGIGAAVCRRLASGGGRVIGVDLRGADVEADLGSAEGRRTAVAGVLRLAGSALDGLVACAGLGPHVTDRAAIVGVNYFGAVATLEGLHDALVAGRGAAVAVSSNSATI